MLYIYTIYVYYKCTRAMSWTWGLALRQIRACQAIQSLCRNTRHPHCGAMLKPKIPWNKQKPKILWVFPVFGHVRHVHFCKENRYTPPGCTNSNEKGKESRKTKGSKDCKNWGLESASFCKVSSRYMQWQNITQISAKPNLPKNSPKHPKIFVLGFTARTGDVHAAFVAASSISWHSESISWTAKGKGHRVLKNATESRKSDGSLKFQVGHMSHSIQTPWKMWHCASSPYRSITCRSSTFPLPFHCSLTILLFPGFKKLQGLLLLCCAGLSVRRAGWGFSLICGLSQDKWPSKMGTCHWEGHQVFLMHICRAQRCSESSALLRDLEKMGQAHTIEKLRGAYKPLEIPGLVASWASCHVSALSQMESAT